MKLNKQDELELYRDKYKDEMRANEGTFIHRENGKRWKLPILVKSGEYMLSKSKKYKVLGFRTPKKGEYYLSGAEVMAWKAPNDLSTKYLVIKFE